MAATFGPSAAENPALVLIEGSMHSSSTHSSPPASSHGPSEPAGDPFLEQLCAAVCEQTGMPPGRVRRVVLAVERQRPRLLLAAAVAAAAAAATADPLRWYPLGANGRLRPPAAVQP